MQKRLAILLIALLIATLAPMSDALAAQQPPRHLPLGINLAGVVSWTTQWPFVDVFKTARAWISQCEGCAWGEGGTLDLTPEGWVASLQAGQYAETVMMDAGDYFPHGEYTLLYDGDGTLEFPLGSAQVVSQEAGKVVLIPNPPSGLWIRISATNPANPIRNIRVLMPGFGRENPKQPFHPAFLQTLRGMKALRFMDWMGTNFSPIVTWAERPKVSDATWGTEKGVPLEILLTLANTLNADAWFNMPHQADDEYVRQFAETVRDQLAPNLKAYVEYSNETWNGQFSQAQYVIEQGTAAGLSSDAFQAGLFYHSQRAVELFTIWEKAFGGTDRLVRVLAAQAANAWTGEQVITFNDAYQHADALAIAPYFGQSFGTPEAAAGTIGLTPEQLLEQAQRDVQTTVRQWISDNVALVQQYDLQLIAYEGGQHLAGVGAEADNEALTALFTAANHDPQMQTVYEKYLRLWSELGGGLFMAFSDVGLCSKWGCWGILDHQAQNPADAPKYQALLSFIGAR